MNDLVYRELLNYKKTPFYVFDTEGFIKNYKSLQNAMKKEYNNYMISYSYKTNYTPYICELVKKLGYTNDKIVYNGPLKGVCLEEHLLNGGIVNIDNLAELERIVGFVDLHKGIKFKIGLRINIDFDSSFISRFGMSLHSPELFEVKQKINVRDNISIVGIHCHISRNRGLEEWKKRSQIMLSAAEKYIEGIPEYISLGSGMFADMDKELKEQFGNVPTYDDYAKVAMKPFANYYKKKQPIIFTEPGTTVVSRYINFVSKVMDIKNIRGRKIATMDGSYENLGEICTLKKLPVKILKSENRGEYFNAIDLMGYTCLEQDMMREGYNGKLAVGDILMFENVGGYSIVSKPQFIKPNCSMVAMEEKGVVNEIMREETFDDVFAKFSFSEA